MCGSVIAIFCMHAKWSVASIYKVKGDVLFLLYVVHHVT